LFLVGSAAERRDEREDEQEALNASHDGHGQKRADASTIPRTCAHFARQISCKAGTGRCSGA
jgi:hypothetical protein